MRLVTFSRGRTAPRLGAVVGPWDAWEAIIDLHAVDPRIPGDILAFIDEAGTLSGAAWERAHQALRRAEKALGRSRPAYAHPADLARLHAPIRPPLLRDFLAFRGHIARTRAARGEKVPAEWDLLPAYYNGNPLNVVGPGETVPYPRTAAFRDGRWRDLRTEKLDYEAELAYVLGRGGRDIAPTRASSYLFGVTIFDDFSMRDLQLTAGRIGMGPAPGKDWANALGPCIVTRDEFGAMRDRRIRVRVSGTERLAGRMGDLVSHSPWVGPGERDSWTFEGMATFLSHVQEIHPGEVWGSGTIPGGCELEKGPEASYLAPGDVVELEVEGLGVLANPIGPAP